MRLSDTTVKELVETAHKIAPNKLIELGNAAVKEKGSLQDLLLKRKLISEKELTQLYAIAIKAKFVELGTIKIDPKVLNRIPERIARQYQAVLFEAGKAGLKLAMADPGDLPAVDFLQKLLGKDVEIYIATSGDITHVLDQYKGELDTELTKVIPEEKDTAEEVSADEVAEDSPVAKTANLIIDYAITAGA